MLRSRDSAAPAAAGDARGGAARCAAFAWGILAYDVAVAAWGAYVRATGSGAGCGSHWPLCNGEIVPHTGRVETLVELSHRLSSGIALVLTFVLLARIWRAFPAHHIARKGALAATGFMAAEALLGAALVLFELVAHDASMKRALSVSLHLVNTFLLLASTALTATWASGTAPPRLRRQGPVSWVLGACFAALLLVGASGAVTALGDTLFPPSSLSTGLAEDFSAAARAHLHLFVRLRVLHPALAAGAAMLVVLSAGFVRTARPVPSVRLFSRLLASLVVAQVGVGLASVWLLAPVWIQLVHLVLADGVWVALVLTSAAALEVRTDRAASEARQADRRSVVTT
jgi:heme A synthase